MPNTEEQEKNTIDFSPIGNGDEATNTPETIKDDSKSKRTSHHSTSGLMRWLE